MKISISDYTYDLKDDRIAKFPVHPRDSSKLLIYQGGNITHAGFSHISNFLPEGTHLVLNNTRVIPARLIFKRKTGAIVEVFLLDPVLPSTLLPLVMEETQRVTWHCAVGNKKKWQVDEELSGEFFVEGKTYTLKAKLNNKDENLVDFYWDGHLFFSQVVAAFGNIPLPPYLHRSAVEDDKIDYQTVYSEPDGAVAAPTAGLHFSEAVFADLERHAVRKSFVTLHVGAGTFMPVKEENALDHPMHSEQILVGLDFIKTLQHYPEKLVAVGTTSMRTLESLYWFGVKILEKAGNPFFIEKMFPYLKHGDYSLNQSLQALVDFLEKEDKKQFVGSTEIMIFPGYTFKVCKGLITNFHQPASTLLLLVAAFIGEDNWKKVYQAAMDNDYRFLSFGDSSLLLP